MSVLAYLRVQMTGLGTFIHEYKNLSVEDRATLHKWALEEMNVLGIKVV